MPSWVKFVFIALLSIFLIALIAISLMIWVVFTPEKLTPILQKQLEKVILCEVKVEEVELTFFSTFPRFGIKTGPIFIHNPLPESPSDTLFRSTRMHAVINFEAFYKRNEIVLEKLNLDEARVFVFTDKEGNANYNIFKPQNRTDTVAFSLPFDLLSISSFTLNNSHITYADASMDMTVVLSNSEMAMEMQWKNDSLQGNLSLQADSFSFLWDSVQYVQNQLLSIQTPWKMYMNESKLTFSDGNLALSNLPFQVDMMLQVNDTEILTDITFLSELLNAQEVYALLQNPFASYLDGMQLAGNVRVDGSIKGKMSSVSQPHFKLNVQFADATFSYRLLPYVLTDIHGTARIDLDLNNEDLWNIQVHDFHVSTGKSLFKGDAGIRQLTGDMQFSVRSWLNFDLADMKPFLPDTMPISLSGRAKGNARLHFLYSDFMNYRFNKMRVNADLQLVNVLAAYDTLSANIPLARTRFHWPTRGAQSDTWLSLHVHAPQTLLLLGEMAHADLQSLDMHVEVNDIMEKGTLPNVKSKYSLGSLEAISDSTRLAASTIRGSLHYNPSKEQASNPLLHIEFQSYALEAQDGNTIVSTSDFLLNTEIAYDSTVQEPLLRWIPTGQIALNEGMAFIPNVSELIYIPSVDFQFDQHEIYIYDSQMLVGKSDFKLTGLVSNIRSYLQNEGMLQANFDFSSSFTDINHLMLLSNGLGVEDESTPTATNKTDASRGPYMVPRGIDVTLRAQIDEALFLDETLSQIEGSVVVRDGLLVLESMLFTSSAAKMQLTAMYETPRRNHLFVGMDFHLLDIDIAELLSMIPDIDTIMPMLRSFAGKGEFHLAIETNLDSAYNIKMSTLRGVSSVRGADLVLMDGETFSEIARKLRFNNREHNKVDSISAEFTIFRNEVDIYPFLISMDRYQAIVSGRHHLDMSFDYHISLIESPLPIQLGVDVRGTLNDLKITPSPPQFPNLFRPARRNALEMRQLEIRDRIRRSLLEKVKP